jgi:predicted phosphodiesterase
MKILHISDLHFGDHNKYLQDSLKERVPAICPDVIVVTGDLVENPNEKLLFAAREFLVGLESHCKERPTNDPKRPRLLLVPGNHDVRYLGSLRVSAMEFSKVFGKYASSYYFLPENVWIHGLDSSAEPWVGANGKVSTRQIHEFTQLYRTLEREHPKTFESAFKIIALHHHPLPLKYSSKHARWLTLLNAGAVLGETLRNKMDLIVHGHEHVSVKAHFGLENREGTLKRIHVISVGAALKKLSGDERNAFNVAVIEPNGEIRVDSYFSENNAFDLKPRGKGFVIRSIEEAKKNTFRELKATRGYSYEDLASITLLEGHGHARRILEFGDLSISNQDCERASRHPLDFPRTSGSIELLNAKSLRGNGIAGLRFRGPQTSMASSLKSTIDYGRKILRNDPISYRCQWWAVNRFAMNEHQARCKYGDDCPTYEFTHTRIEDPVEELTVVLRIPETLSLTDRPEPFVAKSNTVEGVVRFERDAELESRLIKRKALRFIESLRTASLRVSRPEVGYSYGIAWKLPESDALTVTKNTGLIEGIVQATLQLRQKRKDKNQEIITRLLLGLAVTVRDQLMPQDMDPLETSLMVWDADRRKMVVVGAAMVGPTKIESRLDYSSVEFDYGDGVVGEAYKTNTCRLYVKPGNRHSEIPDFYRPLPGMMRHAVLLSIPVRNPDDESSIYAVLNCGSNIPRCPLRNFRAAGGGNNPQQVADLQDAVNRVCFDFLTTSLV